MDEIRELLEARYDLYNRPEFIESDPVQLPHLFSQKEDIEISAFLVACLAWGNRKMIIRKSGELLRIMHNSPFAFTMEAKETDLCGIDLFCHRTFKGTDARFFILALRNIYQNHGGLSRVFEDGFSKDGNAAKALGHFRHIFFEIPYPERTLKHIADVSRGASAKRLNMFLRWMVRKDNRGVDFGIWTGINPAWLKIPLDLHTGNTARKLGLLKRRQNDWQAVCELTEQLQLYDPGDPVKYDFALFGLGVFEKF